MAPLMDLLAIATHPDDAEIGVGGTLAMVAASGKSTGIIDLTDGEPTPYGSPTIRASESSAASAILGISYRRNLGLTNRQVVDTVEARKMLASAIRELKPHTLLLPYWEDAHPDHLAAFSLTTASAFYAKFVKSDLTGEPWTPRRILYYFGFHLRSKATPSLIIDISATFDKKLAALRAYHSQFIAHPSNQQVLEDIEADARYWGSRIYSRYGEALLSREHLAVRSADSLLAL